MRSGDEEDRHKNQTGEKVKKKKKKDRRAVFQLQLVGLISRIKAQHVTTIKTEHMDPERQDAAVLNQLSGQLQTEPRTHCSVCPTPHTHISGAP